MNVLFVYVWLAGNIKSHADESESVNIVTVVEFKYVAYTGYEHW
jgi:hypothetical protein